MTSNRDLQKDEQQTMTSAEKHLLQISRLQDEKESLILQVSVLTDQVEAQGEKIRDLEFTKEELQIKLEEAEQFLESVSSSFFTVVRSDFILFRDLTYSQVHWQHFWHIPLSIYKLLLYNQSLTINKHL